MKTQFETRKGECEEHGMVEAEREIPRPSFPFVVYAVRRFRAQRESFHCPICGAPATVDHAMMSGDTP
jgi:hypothetical protein